MKSRIKEMLGDRLLRLRWAARYKNIFAKFAAYDVKVIVRRKLIAGVPA